MFLSQVGETLALQKAVDQGYVPIDGRLNPSRRAQFSGIIPFVHPLVRAPCKSYRAKSVLGRPTHVMASGKYKADGYVNTKDAGDHHDRW
ncbi:MULTISPECIES: hypothetical protein [Mesorhizobium]|uniref:Uncharacterized protein n=1 Tax=Mesorhizobium ciceri TaxID=39645 RepID=A0AB38TEM9_9HYPH|nr:MULTISPECIES: hypothetical protein [Mesorhizobium]MCQ8875435.1 hypothetical protein [Mesorhizobium sp. LMG17149]MDF3153001.1 hypothetical protein [Mesorhizobium sp. XAP10]MDF3215407.1 hypothetical protein [Mesorhizobium ciceri]MDF3244989.1 hypothetical protein [Mesorhizobium sp. XAP4]UTU53033.1 hypothetical protein LRP29_06190 [Mesorhizobium ciceri]